MRFLGFLLLSVFAITSVAQARGLSAVRHPNESYHSFKNRSVTHIVTEADLQEHGIDFDARTRPEQASVDITQLKIGDLPDAGSYDALLNQFKYVRDTRFLESEDLNFPRRLTWLYPDDGCYARAEMASKKLIDNHFPFPMKVFAFGNLRAVTKNSSYGSVSWWYHVAVIYRVGAQAYVLDPALNPEAPMPLQDWNKAIGGDATPVKFSFCSHDTFDPDADCYKSHAISEIEAESEQRGFFQDEWDRILELNRDPVEELGNNPPWSHN